MKHKNLLFIPLLTVLLSACGPSNQESNSTTNPIAPEVTTPEEITTESSEESLEDTTTDNKEPGGEIDSETSEQDTSTTNPEPDENTDYIPSSGQQLPCGSTTVDGPENLANPLDLGEWQNFDTKSYMPDNFSYIYGNNKVNPKFYNNETGGIKIDDPRKGFQTPLLKSYKKIEFNLHIGTLGPKDKKTEPNKDKEQFHVYGYDITGKWIYTQKIDKVNLDKNNNNNRDIKLDILDSNVRYLEFRMNAFPYDNNNQCYNIGITKVSLKGWDFE